MIKLEKLFFHKTFPNRNTERKMWKKFTLGKVYQKEWKYIFLINERHFLQTETFLCIYSYCCCKMERKFQLKTSKHLFENLNQFFNLIVKKMEFKKLLFLLILILNVNLSSKFPILSWRNLFAKKLFNYELRMKSRRCKDAVFIASKKTRADWGKIEGRKCCA